MTKDPFTHLIIGKAMESHRALGPGLQEEFYHQDLVERLTVSGIEHESKPRRDLVYRGFLADTFEPDIVFPRRLIPELKALRGEFAPSHFTQLLVYQKFWSVPTGMLFDFGKASLVHKRVIYTQAEAEFPVIDLPAWITNPSLAAHLLRLSRQCFEDHKLGYRETTWNGIFSSAFRAESITHTLSPGGTIGNLGTSSLRCIAVENECALSITALSKGVSAADRATLQTCLHWLGFSWGLALHFGRRNVDACFVRAVQKPNLPQIRYPTD